MNIVSLPKCKEKSTWLIGEREKQLHNKLVEFDPKNRLKKELFVGRIEKILEEDLFDPDFNIDTLSVKMKTSKVQLYRKIKQLTGYTPVELIRILRLQHGYNLLTQSEISVNDACYQSGFNNASYFIKCFKLFYGNTPAFFSNKFITNQNAERNRILLNFERNILANRVS